MVKNLPAVLDTLVQSLGWKDPLEKEITTHSSFLAWRIPWTEKPGGLQSMGSQRVRLTERLTVSPRTMRKAKGNRKEFCQENTLVIANTLSNNPRDDSTHGHHQMINTEIRLIMFFAVEDREDLYSQQKQDLELTVPWIMSSLLQNSGLN